MQTFDAVTLQVLWTRCISIVSEAAAALVRTSFSTLVRARVETDDLVLVIDEIEGRILAGHGDLDLAGSLDRLEVVSLRGRGCNCCGEQECGGHQAGKYGSHLVHPLGPRVAELSAFAVVFAAHRERCDG